MSIQGPLSESLLVSRLSTLARRSASDLAGATDAALQFVLDAIGVDGAMFARMDGSLLTVERIAGENFGIAIGQQPGTDHEHLDLIASAQPLVVDDTPAEPTQVIPDWIVERGIRAYVSVPLVGWQGERFGSLSGMGRHPRTFLPLELAALDVAARLLADDLGCARKLTWLNLRQKQLTGIVDLAFDGIITIDRDQRITSFNPAAGEIFGWAADRILGNPFETLIPERLRAAHRSHVFAFSRSGVEHQSKSARLPVFGLRANGEEFPIEASLVQYEVDGAWQATVVLRDISDRRRAEESAATAHQRYQSLFDEAPVMYILTQKREVGIVITDCNGLFLQTVGCTREEIIDHLLIDIFPSELQSDVQERYESSQAGEHTEVERQLLTSDGRLIDVLIQTQPEFAAGGAFHGTRAALIDITARNAATRDLSERARQHAAIANLGQRALASDDPSGLLNDAVKLVAETLQVEFAKVLELLPGENELLLRAGVGWREGLVGTATVGASTDSQAGYTLLSDAAVVVEDLREEQRFSGSPLLWEHGVVSGASTMIRYHDRPYGVLGAHTTHRRSFSEADVDFLRSVANTLATTLARGQAEQALKGAEFKYRTLIEQIPAAIYTQALGSTGPTLYANAHTERMLGYSPAEWRADPDLWFNLLYPDDRDRVVEADRIANETLAPYREEYRMIARDGRVVWVEEEAVLIRDHTGNPSHWQGVSIDVTSRKEAEEGLRQAEAEFRLLFMNNPHPTWVYDRETLEFLMANDAAVTTYGYSREELMKMRLSEIRPPENIPELIQALEVNNAGIRRVHSMRHQKKDGRIIDVELTAHHFEFRGRPASLAIAQDVTERLALEAQLHRRAFFDNLTGLPNRELFLDRLSHARLVAERDCNTIAVLFLDVDDFKIVNDTLGHEAGDTLLLAVADRLQKSMRSGDTVARFGGDEFTILLEGLVEPSEAERVAARLAAALQNPVSVAGREVFASVSIGIAIAGRSDTGEDLLRRADLAMYAAKQRGKARFASFDPGMDTPAWTRLRLEVELRQALDRNEFVLHYQPIVDLESGRVVSLEALVRWQHPTLGLVSPAEFLPVADETGLIVPIGELVMEEACAMAASWVPAWAAISLQPPRINVNLAARQLSDPNLLSAIDRILTGSGLSADSLRLEVTERTLVEELRASRETLRALSALGVRLAIDDFGAGASSLAILQEFDADVLKLDRMFAQNLTTNRRNRAVIHAVTTLAHELGMRVTIEGIETVEQLEIARELGCDNVQGFLISRPVPANDVPPLLEAGMFEALVRVARSHSDPKTAYPLMAVPA